MKSRTKRSSWETPRMPHVTKNEAMCSSGCYFPSLLNLGIFLQDPWGRSCNGGVREWGPITTPQGTGCAAILLNEVCIGIWVLDKNNVRKVVETSGSWGIWVLWMGEELISRLDATLLGKGLKLCYWSKSKNGSVSPQAWLERVKIFLVSLNWKIDLVGNKANTESPDTNRISLVL